MHKILVVEDDLKIADVLRVYLERTGYETQSITDGGLVVDWVQDHNPSLILLDLNLPNKDGITICQEIRRFSQVPIIMITARVEEVDRLVGLELGADDYICKPFSPREVVARVKANLRRCLPVLPIDEQKIGFTIDKLRHIAHFDGELLTLTPVEFRILLALLDPIGSVWPREKLLNRMYDDYRSVGERTVDTHVTNLRRKLQCVRSADECIKSIYGVGYKIDI